MDIPFVWWSLIVGNLLLPNHSLFMKLHIHWYNIMIPLESELWHTVANPTRFDFTSTICAIFGVTHGQQKPILTTLFGYNWCMQHFGLRFQIEIQNHGIGPSGRCRDAVYATLGNETLCFRVWLLLRWRDSCQRSVLAVNIQYNHLIPWLKCQGCCFGCPVTYGHLHN